VRIPHVLDVDSTFRELASDGSQNARSVVIEEEGRWSHGLEVQLVELVDPRNHQDSLGDRSPDADVSQASGARIGRHVNRYGASIPLEIIHFPVDITDAHLLQEGAGCLEIQRAVEVIPDAGHDGHQEPVCKGRKLAVKAGFDQLGSGAPTEHASTEPGQGVGQLAVGLVQPVGNGAVHDVAGDPLLVQIDDLFGRPLGSVEVGFLCAGAQMGQHHVGDIRHALFALGILGVDVVEKTDVLGLLGFPYSVLVDDAGAGGVYQRGAVLHQR
jgi:hypothetical protein